MDEEDERRRQLEFYTKLAGLGAEQMRAIENAEAEQQRPHARQQGLEAHIANRIAKIALVVVVVVTMATVVGVIVSAVVPQLGFSQRRVD